MELIKSDFKRYINTSKNVKVIDIIKSYFKYPTFGYIVNLRMCKMMKIKKKTLLFELFRWNLRRLSIKLGIQIPYYTDIKEGFMIFHYNCIVINGNAKIGKNFTIRHGVTVGDVNGKTPINGDNVTVGAGAKIIGGIKIGNNVVIGANAVVNKDVPDNCVVVGVPARIVKNNQDYIKNK